MLQIHYSLLKTWKRQHAENMCDDALLFKAIQIKSSSLQIQKAYHGPQLQVCLAKKIRTLLHHYCLLEH